MAWKGPCAVGERLQLVELVRNRGVSVSEAARLFGVSRRTAHKWLGRSDALGRERGLEDASRARATQERFEGPALERLLDLRRLHSTWGPRTLLHWMKRRYPRLELPAASTLGDILRRNGLVVPRRRNVAPGVAAYRPGGSTPLEPNDRWTIDFKGDFRLGSGAKCYPLTIRDAVSRLILRIDALPNTRGEPALELLHAAFAEYGLPLELHSDNGTPFGSTGIARLGAVSVFAVKHGIRPVFSRPGKPQDNGGHERMHRDVKAETTRPPGEDFTEQQERFDIFRHCFNDERPHQALGGDTPRSRWQPSSRILSSSTPEPDYPSHWEQRTVGKLGQISWHSTVVGVTKALGGERIGLEPIDDGLWRAHFYALPFGLLDERGADTQVIGVNHPGGAAT